MNTNLNKNDDGIVKNIHSTNYYLLPRHADAFLTVQMENGDWGISDEHAGQFICSANRQEAEERAEKLITHYRFEWLELMLETLPDDTDDPEWDAHEAVCSWVIEAEKRFSARQQQKR